MIARENGRRTLAVVAGLMLGTYLGAAAAQAPSSSAPTTQSNRYNSEPGVQRQSEPCPPGTVAQRDIPNSNTPSAPVSPAPSAKANRFNSEPNAGVDSRDSRRADRDSMQTERDARIASAEPCR